MKRIVATSVMGAFLMTAPFAFALDKAPVEPMAKEPAKTETAPMTKKSEADKAVTQPGLEKTAEAKAPSAKAAPNLKGTAAPLDAKAAKESTASVKAVKKTSKQTKEHKSKPLEVSAQAAKTKAD